MPPRIQVLFGYSWDDFHFGPSTNIDSIGINFCDPTVFWVVWFDSVFVDLFTKKQAGTISGDNFSGWMSGSCLRRLYLSFHFMTCVSELVYWNQLQLAVSNKQFGIDRSFITFQSQRINFGNSWRYQLVPSDPWFGGVSFMVLFDNRCVRTFASTPAGARSVRSLGILLAKKSLVVT